MDSGFPLGGTADRYFKLASAISHISNFRHRDYLKMVRSPPTSAHTTMPIGLPNPTPARAGVCSPASVRRRGKCLGAMLKNTLNAPLEAAAASPSSWPGSFTRAGAFGGRSLGAEIHRGGPARLASAAVSFEPVRSGAGGINSRRSSTQPSCQCYSARGQREPLFGGDTPKSADGAKLLLVIRPGHFVIGGSLGARFFGPRCGFFTIGASRRRQRSPTVSQILYAQ